MRITPPVHVAVPALFSVLGLMSLAPVPDIVIPPFAFVIPPPAIVPAVHVVTPETVTVSVPCSVPPEIVSVAGVIASALLNVAVPRDTLSAAPTLVTVLAGFHVAAAPLTVVSLVTLYAPLMPTVPPLSTTLGAVTLDPACRSWVPPPNSSVVPALPTKLPVEVPPPLKLSLPVCAVADPVLLNGIVTDVVPVRADFLNAVAFVNVAAPPNEFVIVVATCQARVPVFAIPAPLPIGT